MIDWQFKRDAKSQGSSAGSWHDIVYGGYINSKLLLENGFQVTDVEKVVFVLKSFENVLENNDLLHEF